MKGIWQRIGPAWVGEIARSGYEGQVEAILVYSPDRLSRKYAYQVLLIEEFARYGVDVILSNRHKPTILKKNFCCNFRG